MSDELSKTHARRHREGYLDTVLVGAGIDIRCGLDPVTPDCLACDRPTGNAQELPGVAAAALDR